MMEDHEFCDTCEGCRPGILDLQTQRPMPQDHPIMVAINDLWDNETSYAQRRSYIEVTLKNSRRPHDMKLAQEVMQMIQERMKAIDDKEK